MRITIVLLAILTIACYEVKPATGNIYEINGPWTPECQIDTLIFKNLTNLNIQPVLCSDAVFVRRVFLDVIGTLPTAKEARDFLQDRDSTNKRRKLIDQLLKREEFADYWAMKWGDILRIKAEFPVNLWPNAAQAYHRWVRASIAENKPYDKFARELLTSSGSNFRNGPVNFYRAIQNKTPQGIAGAVALAFMGMRVESWPSNRLDGMSAFFSQVGYKPTSEWKEEIVFWDPLQSSKVPGNTAPGRAAITAIGHPSNKVSQASIALKDNNMPLKATFPDGVEVTIPADRDPREVFADWLVSVKNPWFVQCIANRVWAWFLGRGIIHEPDDIRDNNYPTHRELLEYLEQEFVANHYDLKHLYRLILNSKTYQLSSRQHPNSAEAEANFASYPLRRLDAEVLIDAINKVTGTTDLYTSPIPEPFTYIPENMPAIGLPDGSITSPFLALFGRPARATGMLNERDNKPLPAQWLHMLNSSHIQRKIEQGPKLRAIFESGQRPLAIMDELYLTILSRFPTPAELAIIQSHAAQIKPVNGKVNRQQRREDLVDIAWSLINSTEFLYRH
jgi:hypothetical protein